MMDCTPDTTILTFDLETYISRYHPESETRLQRLLFIGENASSDEISKLSYELAERQMKEVGNVKKYKEVFGPREEKEDTPRKHDIHYDHDWVINTEMAAQSQIETLEARLSSAQSHLAKEAIRSAYMSLADFYKRRGELREAMRCLLRSRDFCTTNKQIALVCLEVIEVGIDSGNFAHVNAYITKAEHTSDLLSSSPPLTSSKLQCASGLLYVHEGRYAQAARKFASVSPDLQFNTVISAEDIALYASLLGLASLDRSNLQTLILDSHSFQQRLELVPRMRDALRHFSRAEYGPCLDLLQQIKPELRLDIHLHSHVDTLYQKVLDRCIITYFYPYKSVCLDKMGRAFNMDTEQMEAVIEKLILDGRIKGGRINARDGVLTTKNVHRKRTAMMKRVLKLGTDFVAQTESMILRLSCLEQDLVVQSDHPRNFHGIAGGRAYRSRQQQSSFEPYSSDEEVLANEEDDAMMMDLDGGHEYVGNI